MVGAEVDAGAVACRANHQLEHRFRDVELLSSWKDVVLVKLLTVVPPLCSLQASSVIVIVTTLVNISCLCCFGVVPSIRDTHDDISSQRESLDVSSSNGISVVVVGIHSLVY